jgi:hypothetical protein
MLKALPEPMSEASIDRERRLQRVLYAVIHCDGAEPEVMIARDEEALNQAVALELIASTDPKQLGVRLTAIRGALMEGRWVDALVDWMSVTGRTVDVYPDEPVRESVHDEVSMRLELQIKPIFADEDQ